MTWIPQSSGVTDALRCLRTGPAGTAWAVGDNGTMVETVDAGSTWFALSRGTTAEIAGISLANAGTGWGAMTNGAIVKTTDGGTTWNPQQSGTTNGLFAITAVDASTAWSVGVLGTILKTTNGGTTWVTQPSGTTNVLFGVAAVDASTAWAVGAGGLILKTTNGGTTWVPQTSGTAQILLGVTFADASTGWAVGVGGTIIKTTNGGTTWVPQTSGTAQLLRSVKFNGPNTGWAVGEAGTIVRTVNGGGTWTPQPSGTVNGLYAVDFPDAVTGWACGAVGTLLKSTDGGASWTPQSLRTNNLLRAVDFLNASTGWVAGGGGTILHTPADADLLSIEGPTRIETAVKASQEVFVSADTVVIATAFNFPDALGGSSLAGALRAPLLLTRTDDLPPAVVAEIVRLKAKRVVILGSDRAVGAGVANALAGLVGGPANVERVGGPDRYATAALIAQKTVSVIGAGSFDKTVFIATGENFPDALAASPLAAAKSVHILLTRKDSLPAVSGDMIATLGANKAFVLGSAAAVSDGVVGAVSAKGAAPTRLAGPTRYQTAIAVANQGISEGLTWNGLAIATGANYPDALSGGVMCGRLGSVMLLTQPDVLTPDVGTALTAHKSEIDTARFLGSSSRGERRCGSAVAAALR